VTIYEKEVAEFVSEEGESFFFVFFFEGKEVSRFFLKGKGGANFLSRRPPQRVRRNLVINLTLRIKSSTETMINADGENVDLYIPRKCSWTNRLITCKDHAAIQVNVGHLGPDGTYNGNYSTFAISGYVRNKVRR
jgi:small subunit ribosomal protein S21e